MDLHLPFICISILHFPSGAWAVGCPTTIDQHLDFYLLVLLYYNFLYYAFRNVPNSWKLKSRKSDPIQQNPGDLAIYRKYISQQIWTSQKLLSKNTTTDLNFIGRTQIIFQIFLWCLKAKFQIRFSAEGCLWLTPQHLFID